MSGAAGSLSLHSERPCWINIGHEAWRVNLIRCWNEDNVHAKILKHLQIAWQVAWVAFQVFVRAKLGWVNENTRGKDFVLFASLAHKREMPFMEKSHCRDKSDIFGASASRALSHHLQDCGDYSHSSSAPVSARACKVIEVIGNPLILPKVYHRVRLSAIEMQGGFKA